MTHTKPHRDGRTNGTTGMHPRHRERNKKIIELRKSGLLLEDIATRFGLTYQRVAQIILKYDPTLTTKR